MDDLVIAEILFVLEFPQITDLPVLAGKALEDGYDSPSLRLLAGLTEAEQDEAPFLFNKALKEMRRPTIAGADALRGYIRFVAHEICHQNISPQMGARKIWDASTRTRIENFHEADTFIYAVSELESRPQDKDFFINEIILEAERWYAKSR